MESKLINPLVLTAKSRFSEIINWVRLASDGSRMRIPVAVNQRKLGKSIYKALHHHLTLKGIPARVSIKYGLGWIILVKREAKPNVSPQEALK